MNDDELDHLLAKGKLGSPRAEKVMDKLLAERRRSRRRRLVMVWGGPMLAMAAVLVFMLRGSDGGFHARGDGEGPVIEVTCKDGTADRCPAGGTLVFRVDGAIAGGFLAAWAEPAGGGKRVWYFASGAPRLMAQPETQVVPFGVQLGPEQAPGVWEIHALVADRPPPRDADGAVIKKLTVTP
jgi:hypothetical protein